MFSLRSVCACVRCVSVSDWPENLSVSGSPRKIFFSSPSQTIAHKFSIWTPFGVLNFIYKFVSCVTHITSNFLFGSWFANSLTHAKVALSAQEINSALRLRRLEFRVEHSDVVFCNISHTQ